MSNITQQVIHAQVKADPREESYEWIQGIQESLNEQIEELEEQMDSVTFKGKVKR